MTSRFRTWWRVRTKVLRIWKERVVVHAASRYNQGGFSKRNLGDTGCGPEHTFRDSKGKSHLHKARHIQ